MLGSLWAACWPLFWLTFADCSLTFTDLSSYSLASTDSLLASYLWLSARWLVFWLLSAWLFRCDFSDGSGLFYSVLFPITTTSYCLDSEYEASFSCECFELIFWDGIDWDAFDLDDFRAEGAFSDGWTDFSSSGLTDGAFWEGWTDFESFSCTVAIAPTWEGCSDFAYSFFIDEPLCDGWADLSSAATPDSLSFWEWHSEVSFCLTEGLID